MDASAPNLWGDAFTSFQNALANPLTLGGLSLLSGGDLNSGIQAGARLQDMAQRQRRQQAIQQGLMSMPGLSPGDQQILANSPELASDVLSKVYAQRFDPLADIRKQGLLLDNRAKEAEIGQEPLKAKLTQAQIDALNSKDEVTKMFSGLLSAPDAPTPQAAAPPTGSVQPQSYNAQPAMPGIVNASNVTTPPQAQSQPMLTPVADTSPAEGSSDDTATTPTAALSPGAVYSMPGNEMVPTPFGTMTRDKARKLGAAAALAGKGDLSKILMDAATGGGGQMSRAGQQVNDKEELSATNQLATLNSIRDNYNAKYLNIPNRFAYWGMALKDKFGNLSDDEKKDLSGYTQFRQSGWHNLNKVLKDLSGTAVTENEMQRQLLDMPNPGQKPWDGDSPTEFAAKLKGSLTFATSAIARARYLRSQGFVGLPWKSNPDAIDAMVEKGSIPRIEDMPGIINRRQTEIEQQLKQKNPNGDPMVLQRAADQQVKREFGI